MKRSVDNISTFLSSVKQDTVRSSSAEAAQQQRSAPAPSGNVTQRVLQMVLASPNGINLGQLYKESSLDFTVFAETIERLKKLGAIRVETGSEIAFPGPNSSEVESLIS